jgi:hypothetical protein
LISAVFSEIQRSDADWLRNIITYQARKNMQSLSEFIAGVQAGSRQTCFTLKNPDEVRISYYMLRHMIQLNDLAKADDMELLLSNRAIKELVVQKVIPNNGNEEYRNYKSYFLQNNPTTQFHFRT